MSSIAARRILDAWDVAGETSPARKPAALIASLADGRSEDELLDLPVGVCDALLLRIHQRLFGPDLHAVYECPSCGERFEFSVSTGDLLGSLAATVPNVSRELSVNGYSITYRIPTGRDLGCAGECGDLEESRRSLLRSCIVKASTDETDSIDPTTLPADIVCKIGEEMAKGDPCADLSFALECSSCSRAWEASLDVAAFVWTKIQALAHRLLEEVSVLAAHYGWSESTILGLSERRRRTYLQMVGA